MLWLVPHLFPPAQLLDLATQDLRVPALETLLARGTRQACTGEGIEAALCAALGIARQQDWPLAPVTLQADGADAGEAYWLRADPVHLRVMRDRIVLADSVELNVSQDEAEALAASIAQHFGETFQPLPLHPQRWYLKFARAPELATTPLSVATGCNIETALPQGRDAAQYKAVLNELQMLLFAHPVNQAREARGELPINSLWLWGGGQRPEPAGQPLTVYAQTAEASALAAFCNAGLHRLPAQLDQHTLDPGNLILLDHLTAAGQYGDAYGWRDTLRTLETNWFEPVWAHLRSGKASSLRILDPINGQALAIRRADTWKFWRRKRRLGSAG